MNLNLQHSSMQLVAMIRRIIMLLSSTCRQRMQNEWNVYFLTLETGISALTLLSLEDHCDDDSYGEGAGVKTAKLVFLKTKEDKRRGGLFYFLDGRRLNEGLCCSIDHQ